MSEEEYTLRFDDDDNVNLLLFKGIEAAGKAFKARIDRDGPAMEEALAVMTAAHFPVRLQRDLMWIAQTVQSKTLLP